MKNEIEMYEILEISGHTELNLLKIYLGLQLLVRMEVTYKFLCYER
jgi:hypothetical protein